VASREIERAGLPGPKAASTARSAWCPRLAHTHFACALACITWSITWLHDILHPCYTSYYIYDYITHYMWLHGLLQYFTCALHVSWLDHTICYMPVTYIITWTITWFITSVYINITWEYMSITCSLTWIHKMLHAYYMSYYTYDYMINYMWLHGPLQHFTCSLHVSWLDHTICYMPVTSIITWMITECIT